MKQKFKDPLIPRKKKITDNVQLIDEKIPLPSVIEISESGMCNRTCSFCPRSAPDYPHKNEFISDDLIKKISSELSKFHFKGIFLFSGFVEPMLDKNIFNLIKIVRKNLPLCKIEMVTNGDVLNDTRTLKLFESGLSTLLISIYDGKKEADNMKKMLDKAGIAETKYKIRHRYLSENDSFGITLSNRSGMMENAEYKIKALSEPLKKPCYYPHYTFFMDYNGDVLVCSHDWGKKLIVGSLVKEKFIDIWLGKKFQFARKKLLEGNRKFSPCNLCDVDGELMGFEHAKIWNSSYKN